MEIYKYALEITDHQHIAVRGLREVLSVAVQNDRLVMYLMVKPEDEIVGMVDVLIIGTGHEFTPMTSDYVFFGTHALAEGRLMWHVWSRVE